MNSRAASPRAITAPRSPFSPKDEVVTLSQNFRNFPTRLSGEFPAMIAALIDPMEMPATQSGASPVSARAS
jgi:hypothetical protein